MASPSPNDGVDPTERHSMPGSFLHMHAHRHEGGPGFGVLYSAMELC